MKKPLLISFAILVIIITGCSFGQDGAISVEEINQCIGDNEALGLNKSIEICQISCAGNIPCERRVAVIAAEKFGKDVPEIIKKEKEVETQDLAPKKEVTKEEQEIEKETEERENEDKKEKETKTDPTATNGLVALAGVSCDNKEDLPDRMKVWAERVDEIDWRWIVPHGKPWEFTDLAPGQYKIYYAPERHTQPLAKYSQFIADGSGSHDYKILDLSNGGEVRGIEPCDWE